MSWKLRKDRSRLAESGRIRVFPSDRHYFQIYLWEDMESLNLAIDNDSGNFLHQPGETERCDGAALAACCHSPVRLRVEADGSDEILLRPKLGEMHYTKGRWGMEIVAHECTHAALGACWHIGPDRESLLEQAGDAEETLAHRVGLMTSATYRWLWKLDPQA